MARGGSSPLRRTRKARVIGLFASSEAAAAGGHEARGNKARQSPSDRGRPRPAAPGGGPVDRDVSLAGLEGPRLALTRRWLARRPAAVGGRSAFFGRVAGVS